jgi:hypothetical protein
VQNVRAVQRFLSWLQYDYFPFYRARPIDAPVLHILCTDEPRIIEAMSRFGWRAMARRGIEEHFVALDHENVFNEANLPKIVEMISRFNGSCGDD